MGVLGLVVVGCGSSSPGSGNIAPASPPVAPVHSSLKRGVVFGLASNDGQNSIDVPIGTSPEIRIAQAQVLGKVETTPQVLRRQVDTPSALQQRLASSDLTFSTFTTTPLKGPEPSIAYKQGSTQSVHNGITFSCAPMFAPGTHSLSAQFDFPGTGPLGVFPYLQVGQLFQSSSPNNRGAASSSQSGVTFGMTTSVNGDGTGTQEVTLEGGILYSGPLLNIVPWVSSFQSGLHHAKVVIDGEIVVDEDFIQRGLLFRDRLPQISAGQPDNIAVNTSFGWTENDQSIDDTIPVDSPRWRAALGNNTVQAAGSLSNSAWHDGSAVSFTINNLKETLTKNLEPLAPIAKTFESNKTISYKVQAQALALFRYFDMSDTGSVPGFRRDAILSNFQQTPPLATPGSPVVFEFDINAINFESGTPYVNFGLAEDPVTGDFAFFSHGELSEIDSGWHVRVPWLATQLSSTTGFLTVSVAETSDPAKSAFAEQEFQVSIGQANGSSAGTSNAAGTITAGNTGNNTGTGNPGTSGSGGQTATATATAGTGNTTATSGGTGNTTNTTGTTVDPPNTNGGSNGTGPGTSGTTGTSGGPVSEGLVGGAATAGTSGSGTNGGGVKEPTIEITYANTGSPYLDPGETNYGQSLSFTIETHDAPDSIINWDVSILDSNNQLFHHFSPPGSPPGTNTGHTELGTIWTEQNVGPWNGRNDAGQEISGEFTWVVSANVTTLVAGPGGGKTGIAAPKKVTNRTVSPEIEVFANIKGQRKRVALYKNRDPEVIDLQKYIFPYGRNGQSPVLDIEVSNLQSPLPIRVIDIHSTVSGHDDSVFLRKDGNKYTGQYTIDSRLIKQGDSLRKDGRAVKTTATACLGYGNIRQDAPASFINEIFAESVSDKAYPPAAQRMGLLDDRIAGPQPQSKVFKTVALPTTENIACFGFEALEMTLAGRPETETVLKVRHPANEVWLGVHGGADGSIGSLTDKKVSETVLPGRDITSSDTQNIRTLVLSACQALDLHDYNNLLHSPSDGMSARQSPGKLWWNATSLGKSISGGHTVLLGFNRITGGPVWNAYRDELTRLTRISSVATGNLEAFAWMKSNYDAAKSGHLIQSAAACAWSSGNYYYIPYELDPDPKVRWRTPAGEVFQVANKGKMTGVYRIPETHWDRTPTSWVEIPDFAKPVTIP